MSNELFPAETVASESPRLRWLRENNLHCHRMPAHFTESPWTCALQLQFMKTFHRADYGTGDTAEEACVDYAAKHGLRTWEGGA